MQPRFVVKRVISDLVPVFGKHRNRIVISFQNRVLTDNEKGRPQTVIIEEPQHVGNNSAQVPGKIFPRRLTTHL